MIKFILLITYKKPYVLDVLLDLLIQDFINVILLILLIQN